MRGLQGTKPCGCVTWLYAPEYDTPSQRRKTIEKAIREGLTVTLIEDDDTARAAWGPCPHEPQPVPADEAKAEADRLLTLAMVRSDRP